MIALLLKIYRKRKLKQHIASLFRQCVVGEGFCTSNFYKDSSQQLLM